MNPTNLQFLRHAARELQPHNNATAARLLAIADAEDAAHRQVEAAAPPAPKTRTITLTDRRPVTIREDEWPIVAKATGDSYGSHDYSRHQQALSQGELDKYSLRVRQHADGRTIVYGVFDAASAWTGSEDWAGGEVLDGRSLCLTCQGKKIYNIPGESTDRACERCDGTGSIVGSADIPAAIRRVGEDGHLPDAIIRECLADLPAEEI